MTKRSKLVIVEDQLVVLISKITQQGRNFDLLTITEPPAADYEEGGGKGVKKRTVVVMARQQPGESPSSLIVQASLLHSHWSRNVEARLLLVESFPSDACASSLMP